MTHHAKSTPKTPPELIFAPCKHCGTLFQVVRPWQLYCSSSHRAAAKNASRKAAIEALEQENKLLHEQLKGLK